MSATPREIGTLIVVVLKANHLPNKRHIGKQDPYCVVTFNGDKRRTKAIKRGGQHPEWDEEIRFTLYEDSNSAAGKHANGNGPPSPPPPPSKEKSLKKTLGGSTMKLACFADDAREPDLIGEADVDLTEVLNTGETDEWFTLMNKDKFSGKVYLELTFWSNERPPEKKVAPKHSQNRQYGGPGDFVPIAESPSDPPIGTAHQSRTVSMGSLYDHSRENSDSIPSSLRASSSLAKLDLYVPPYERNKVSPIDTMTNNFNEFGVSDRRDGFQAIHGGQARSISPGGYSTFSSQHSHGYDQTISEPSTYTYDSLSHPPHHTRPSISHYQASYQPQYENQQPYHPRGRGPRHSVPTSSSGFMPLQNATTFPPLASHASEPALFNGSHLTYNTSHFHVQPMYTPQTSATPNAVAPSSSGTFLPQQSFPQSQSFQYSQYPPSVTPAPQTYPSATNPSQLPLVQQTPQPYQTYASTHSPSHEVVAIPSLPQSTSLSSSFGAGSRPLPQQPQVVYTQPSVSTVYPVPLSVSSQEPINSFTPPQPGTSVFPGNGTYQQPPPPPPPPIQYTVGQFQSAFVPSSQTLAIVPPPPPPPPHPSNSPARRHSSLPQPPVLYQQPPQPAYQPPPLPPPPLSENFNHPLPPPPPPPLVQNLPYHPVPPPNPPTSIDYQGQWAAHSGYAQQGFA